MKKESSEERLIRTSRWNYFAYYLMVLAIILFVAYIKINDLRLEKSLFIASVIFCVMVIKATEVHRLSSYCKITPHGLEKVEGIFIKKHKKINYASVSQIHLTTNPINKILDIGTIRIDLFSDTEMVEIKNINKPKEFIREVSKHIHNR